MGSCSNCKAAAHGIVRWKRIKYSRRSDTGAKKKLGNLPQSFLNSSLTNALNEALRETSTYQSQRRGRRSSLALD